MDQVEDQQMQALRGQGRIEEVSKQLAGRIGKEPALTESELRLLLRLTLQNDNLDTAGEAVADARSRFPDSPTLVRRQLEFEKRKGNLEGRVAALQRLVALQPKQKIEWLREIVRAYQDEGLWDKALAAAQRVVEEAPASPDSHVLAADLNFGAQHFDAGVAKLREAIKLSDKPNDLRLRLARAFLEAGRGEEARQTYDAVFEAETDPKVRLSLTRQLAEVYAQQGRLDELIGRFRQKQRAEEGGWRYALYLAEILQQMQDFGGAREELTKALGARSRDGNFLRQLMRLCEAEGNTAEAARFARLLTEAEPSEAHQIDFAAALLDNRDTEEAFKVLRTNQESFLKNPMLWREVLLKFQLAGAGVALTDTLRASLESRPVDWRGRLTLAEMQLSQSDWAGAEYWLWQILAIPPEPPAPPAAAPPAANSPYGVVFMGGGYYSGLRSTGASKLTLRISRSMMIRQGLAQILSGMNNGMSRSRYSSWGNPYGGTTAAVAGTLEEARDSAIVYLAMLAQQQDRGEAFLEEMEKRLAGASRAERIVTFGLVQALDKVRREIEIEAAQSSGDPSLDQYCLQILFSTARLEARQKRGQPQDMSLIETFLAREHQPQQALLGKMGYYEALVQAGRLDDANKIADEVLAQADTIDPQLLPMVFGFAVQRQAFDVAEKALPRLLAASQQPGQNALKQQTSWYRYSLAAGLLQKKETVGRGVQLLAAMLAESYPTRLPSAMISLSPYARRSYRAAWRDAQPFPYPNRYLDEARIQMWRQIFEQLKTANAMDELKEVLNRHIQSLPEDQTVFSQLARACFWWWNGDRGDAIHEVYQLAKELKDDDLRMMAAAMMAEADQPAEALQMLEQVTASTGDIGIDKQLRMLALARKANNLDRAREIALQLSAQRLDANDTPQLMQVLQELGLKEKAEEIGKRIAGTRQMGSRNRIEDQLAQQVNAKNEKDALALARTILARDPLTLSRQGEDYGRQRAISALRTFKALDSYIAELERQLAEAPNSVRTVYLLAEAQGEDSPKALGYYRRLVELKPADTSFQLRLATMLSRGKQPEEAMNIWEAVLARDPEPVMQTAFSQMVEIYRNARQMGRLGAALVKLPKRPAALASLAMYGGGQDFTGYFSQVAQELQSDGATADAIRVWRVALSRIDERRSGDLSGLLSPLVSALIETGDKAGAVEEVDRYLFPPVKPKPLFGFDNMGMARNWQQVTSTGDGRIILPLSGLLRLIRQVDALAPLRAKAVASVAAGDESDSLLILLIDAQQRNAATLEDFSNRMRATMGQATERHDPMALQFLQALAQELREWPEGRRLALELMLGVQKGYAPAQYGGYQIQVGPQAAELAMELGEQETARGVLRDWQANLQRQAPANRYGFDYRQQIPTMELMARLGMSEEVKVQLKTMKENPQMKGDTYGRQKVEEFENRIALLAGSGRASIAAWAVPNTEMEKGTTVCWEIGGAVVARRDASRSRGLSVSADDLPTLDGRYDVEIYQGPTPSSMKLLATLPAAKSRGLWISPAPLGAGYVMSVARDKVNVLFSNPSAVITGRNLVVNSAALSRCGTGKREAVEGGKPYRSRLARDRRGGGDLAERGTASRRTLYAPSTRSSVE